MKLTKRHSENKAEYRIAYPGWYSDIALKKKQSSRKSQVSPVLPLLGYQLLKPLPLLSLRKLLWEASLFNEQLPIFKTRFPLLQDTAADWTSPSFTVSENKVQ